MLKESLFSPVSGIIAQIVRHSGDAVKLNDVICNVEVMKLFYNVTAGIDGMVHLVINEGQFVQEGQELGYILGES